MLFRSVYAVRSPDERRIWVSFSGVEHDAYIDVVDVATRKVERSLHLGKKIYHLDFTPRGTFVLATANVDEKLFLVDAERFTVVDQQPLRSPSGVYGPWRAFRLGL